MLGEWRAAGPHSPRAPGFRLSGRHAAFLGIAHDERLAQICEAPEGDPFGTTLANPEKIRVLNLKLHRALSQPVTRDPAHFFGSPMVIGRRESLCEVVERLFETPLNRERSVTKPAEISSEIDASQMRRRLACRGLIDVLIAAPWAESRAVRWC